MKKSKGEGAEGEERGRKKIEAVDEQEKEEEE